MSLSIALRPVEIATHSADSEGRLVLIDDRLAGVLVRLDDVAHAEEIRGRWFLEASFGALPEHGPLTFATLDEAATWVMHISPGLESR